MITKMSPEKAKNIYWGAMPLPKGAKSLGEYVSDNKRGCFIVLENGKQVVGNSGAICNIRGGSMPGAGAPEKAEHLKKKQLGIQLTKWVVDQLDNLQGSRQANIEAAVIAHYKLNIPLTD